jgi:hypothetical protein
MNEHGKSDRPVVPAKSPNKAGQPAAEGREGSGLTKGNLHQQNASPTPIELKRRMHDPIPEVGRWLRSVVGEHIRYYGVPTNRAALYTFRFQVGRLWHRTLLRRHLWHYHELHIHAFMILAAYHRAHHHVLARFCGGG